MKTFEDISVQIKDNLAYVEIQRPPNNFFDYLLIQQIADVLEELDEQSECRVNILASEGKNFCAGANFSQDTEMMNKSNPYSKLYREAVRLFRTRKPIIAAVQGAAVGGGLGLALAADFRIASPESKFSANFAKLGFHQGFGSSVTLPRVVGTQNAAMMLYTAKRVKGEEAFNLGLVDSLVPTSDILKKANEFALEIASSAPMAVESIRATVRRDLADQVEEIVALELSEQIRLQSSDDFKEGIAASLERREATFNRS